MNDTILGTGINRNTYLYRTIQKERLLEVFITRQNVPVRPKKRDDPYENLAFLQPHHKDWQQRSLPPECKWVFCFRDEPNIDERRSTNKARVG